MYSDAQIKQFQHFPPSRCIPATPLFPQVWPNTVIWCHNLWILYSIFCSSWEMFVLFVWITILKEISDGSVSDFKGPLPHPYRGLFWYEYNEMSLFCMSTIFVCSEFMLTIFPDEAFQNTAPGCMYNSKMLAVDAP